MKQEALIATNSVEITDPNHLADIWHAMGVMHAAKLARKWAEKHKIVGMTLMADLLEADALKAETRFKFQNIGLAAKHGMDFTHGSLSLRTDGGSVLLVLEPDSEAA